ncbi:hypothetical protein DOTSEDRAFT_34892 [Dothistroma septosporum NZE10]|uniref:Uncharacterized protein n=1 Tax=Dothistroma septosporum (strain NZE10 / CBS 128990) TaxID=675120 RepID=N1PQ21_DOTSN|nr:hypothetical protein DOTSEDRAFT_34892 [Dothistroma septosporum NZE10]
MPVSGLMDAEMEDERIDDEENDWDAESLRGQCLPRTDSQMNMLTDLLDFMLQSMSRESRDQRRRLAQQLMDKDMRERPERDRKSWTSSRKFACCAANAWCTRATQSWRINELREKQVLSGVARAPASSTLGLRNYPPNQS